MKARKLTTLWVASAHASKPGVEAEVALQRISGQRSRILQTSVPDSTQLQSVFKTNVYTSLARMTGEAARKAKTISFELSPSYGS